MSNGYDALPNKRDLEEGRPESTRSWIHRLVHVRRRCLLVSAYVVFLFVFLFVAGLQYVEQRELALRRPLAPESTVINTMPDPSLPRHPHYIIFKPSLSPPVSLADRPLKPASKLPEYCLESSFALGYPCFNTNPVSFDMVWTWVNGSDKRLHEAMADAALEVHPEIGAVGKNHISTSLPTSKLYR